MSKNILYVGAGRAAIEFPDNFFPYSGFRGRYMCGVHDDINARAIVIKNDDTTLLIVSIELGDVTDEWIPEISRETGIAKENIYLTATHTHEAPYANSTWTERVEDEEKTEPFCKACIDAVLKAALQALEEIRPAKMSFGNGQCYVNVSRVHKYEGNQAGFTAPYIGMPDYNSFSDHTVSVIRFADHEDNIIAYLTNYAVHSSVQFRQSWDKSSGNLVSGDLSGAAMRYVEKRIPGAVSLMTLGAAGDQIPRAEMIHNVLDKDGNVSMEDYGNEAGYALSDAMGRELGEIIIYAGEGSCENEIDAAVLNSESVSFTVKGKRPWDGGPPFALPKDYKYIQADDINFKLMLMRIGPLALLGIPAELVASLGFDLKKELINAGFEHVLIVTQCNGSFQYISDDQGYKDMTFEATESHFMPEIGGKILANALILAKKIL